MDLNKLGAKFPAKDITWRVQSAGSSAKGPWAMVLAYVDARAIMGRLDDVCGPGGWQTEYEQWDGGVVCKLSLLVRGTPNPATGTSIGGMWVTKADGSPETKVEAFKGGLSKSLVRSAVSWNIGRYLYDLPSTFAKCSKDKPANTEGWKKEKDYWWQIPKLPAWALPDDMNAEIEEPSNKDSIIFEIQTIEEVLRAKGHKFTDEQEKMLKTLDNQPEKVLSAIKGKLSKV